MSAHAHTTARLEQPPGYTLSEVPRFVQYTSPVPPPSSRQGSQLPLNLIALIVSHLDDIGDIARVTRTSRLLYYMTLPQLYERVSLHSYAQIRYVGGRPEGYGGGSPFMAALNGLVTKKHAAVVKELKLWGAWNEPGSEDFAKGRVPDNSMLLNTLLRACLDRMPLLATFAWELDVKPLKTLYSGLSARPSLTSLTLRFPSSRIPRPAVVVPPMPALRVFKATDIDPLCHPDDVSLLIASSPHLSDLRLHFSPRIRLNAEPTLNLDSYFGRCTSLPKLKHLALQNWFGPTGHGFARLTEQSQLQSMSALDTFGGVGSASANVYVDDSWRMMALRTRQALRRLRFNDFAWHHVDMLKSSSGLERVYVVNDTLETPGSAAPGKTASTDDAAELITPSDSPNLDTSREQSVDMHSLGSAYMHALTRSHGSTLRHLLLSSQWHLTPEQISDVVRFCPNLSQLGLAVGAQTQSTLKLLLPFLPKLWAVRVLENAQLRDAEGGVDAEARRVEMERELAENALGVRWVGFGGHVYWVGGVEERDVGGRRERRRVVKSVEIEDVRHVHVWGMDRLDVVDEVVQFG